MPKMSDLHHYHYATFWMKTYLLDYIIFKLHSVNINKSMDTYMTLFPASKSCGSKSCQPLRPRSVQTLKNFFKFI